jgi:hypothetical protein
MRVNDNYDLIKYWLMCDQNALRGYEHTSAESAWG